MPRDSTLEERLRTRLAEIELNGLQRSLRPPSGIDLSSNDYLGLSKHPQVVTRFMEGVAREGCGSTGSRLLRGQRPLCAERRDRAALPPGMALGRRDHDVGGIDRADAAPLSAVAGRPARARAEPVVLRDRGEHGAAGGVRVLVGVHVEPALPGGFDPLERARDEPPALASGSLVVRDLHRHARARVDLRGDEDDVADHDGEKQPARALPEIEDGHQCRITHHRGTEDTE